MLTRLKGFLARRRELKELDVSVVGRPRPAPAELVQVDAREAVWRVPVPGQADRFMSAKPGAINDEMFVVRVDTEAFYRAWLRSSSTGRETRSDNCPLRSEMPQDYKFKHAVQGFAHGRENPVPLAFAGAHQERHRVDIGFSNGVTRSFWLIANKAPSFPIQVHGRESAELLNKVCGLDPAPLSFTELFAQAQRQAPQVATPARPAPAAATRPAPKVQPRPGRSGPRKGRGL
ncbi:hypothetical protein U4U03_22645 [Escherichia coli]|nr:hypothetical protein [Escherichia coli]